MPVGLVKIGRQESHWGMGLLANHGNGFDDTFGENHAGATYDRVVFATKPLAIIGAAAGKDKLADIPLILPSASIVWSRIPSSSTTATSARAA